MADSSSERNDHGDNLEVKQQDSSGPDDENQYSDASSSDSDFYFEFKCEICNKKFSGPKPLRQHEKGAQHLKRVRKKDAEKKLTTKLEEDSLENEDDKLDPNDFAVCKTCKKNFTGPESLEQHLKSSSHRKKMAAAKLLEEIRDKDGHISLEKLKQKRKERKSKKSLPLVVGEITKQSYSFPNPLELQGRKNGAYGYSESEEPREDSSDDQISAETQEFECLDCKKVFTGINPWYQHLVSKVHEKTLKQKELQDRLRITRTKVSEECSTDQCLVQEGDDVISCRLCHVAFSGPESASTHLKSKKHRKQLELKKWKRTMKESKKAIENKLSEKIESGLEYSSSIEDRSEARSEKCQPENGISKTAATKVENKLSEKKEFDFEYSRSTEDRSETRSEKVPETGISETATTKTETDKNKCSVVRNDSKSDLEMSLSSKFYKETRL